MPLIKIEQQWLLINYINEKKSMKSVNKKSIDCFSFKKQQKKVTNVNKIDKRGKERGHIN